MLDTAYTDDREVESLVDQASSLIEKQLFSEAMTKLHRGLSVDPTNVRALENLVICNLELGKPKMAIQALNSLLQIEPTSSVRWGDKGFIHLLLNENSEGIGALRYECVFTKAKSLNINNGTPHHLANAWAASFSM